MTSDDGGAPPRARMHADEVFTDAAQVRRLLASQFPHWAALPLRPVRSHGTDNTIYRLGADMTVRLPRRPSAVAQVERERHWLPRLAPHLPLPIPVPLAVGEPGEGCAWPWSVCPWLAGENPVPGRIEDEAGLARDLAAFVLALRRIDSPQGPPPGRHNFGRGAPLALRDPAVRAALQALAGTIDVEATAAMWKRDLHAPVWDGAPMWIHGDLNAGNLLLRDGRLSGVIDFGGMAVGDPACDLLAAWYLFGREARRAFRAALMADDASWARGRGWALSMALIGLSYYKDTSPAIAANALRAIDAILTDSEA